MSLGPCSFEWRRPEQWSLKIVRDKRSLWIQIVNPCNWFEYVHVSSLMLKPKPTLFSKRGGCEYKSNQMKVSLLLRGFAKVASHSKQTQDWFQFQHFPFVVVEKVKRERASEEKLEEKTKVWTIWNNFLAPDARSHSIKLKHLFIPYILLKFESFIKIVHHRGRRRAGIVFLWLVNVLSSGPTT